MPDLTLTPTRSLPEPETTVTFERVVEMTGAFDKRHPDPSKNYGIHGMEIRFVLKGPSGALQFLVYTNMHLPHVHTEQHAKRHEAWMYAPMGADIGYHSPIAMYDGQTAIHEECPYLDGRPCYYDGTGLGAQEFMPTFLAGGSDAVWKMLEARYHEQFAALSAFDASPEGTDGK